MPASSPIHTCKSLRHAAGVLGLATAASAGTVTYAGGVAPQGSTATVAMFDTSLGTLISLRVEAVFGVSANVHNNDLCSGFNFVGCSENLTGELRSSASFQLGSMALDLFDVATGNRHWDVLHNQVANCRVNRQVRDIASDAATLALFSGPGDVSMAFQHSLSGSGGTVSDLMGLLGQIVVTYNYMEAKQDVPEPGSLALVAAAGLTLLGSRPRRPVRTTR
jgi:hypothetical protein